MRDDEERVRVNLRRIGREASVDGLDSKVLRSRARRRQIRWGAGTLVALLLMGGATVSAMSFVEGSSGIEPSGTGTTSPSSESNDVSESSPSPSATDGASPDPSSPDDAEEKLPASFGFGRIPHGEVNICPEGPFIQAEGGQEAAREAGVSLVEAANAPSPDVDTVWNLMDPVLREAFGSREKFSQRISNKELDPTYAEWSFWDKVTLNGGPVIGDLIKDQCGEEVQSATVFVQVFFPRCQCVSGGGAQLYFVMGEDGPRFWILD